MVKSNRGALYHLTKWNIATYPTVKLLVCCQEKRKTWSLYTSVINLNNLGRLEHLRSPTLPTYCKPNQHRCNTGECIPNTWVCDGAVVSGPLFLRTQAVYFKLPCRLGLRRRFRWRRLRTVYERIPSARKRNFAVSQYREVDAYDCWNMCASLCRSKKLYMHVFQLQVRLILEKLMYRTN